MTFSIETLGVDSTAVRELDLRIAPVARVQAACPFGALEMNLRTTACPFGALEMNRRTVTTIA